jgi:PHD/YefM family antitoxin component YafN of YafNO toxin-antitoxin module
MNVVSTTVLRNNLAATIDEVNKNRDYLLVAKKGKLVSALVNLDFLEDLLALTSEKYLKSIKEARNDYKKGRVYSFEEVFGEV